MNTAVKQQPLQRKQQKASNGEPLSFSVPEKLLRLSQNSVDALTDSTAAAGVKKSLHWAASLFFGGGGSFICDYRNGAADVREFFAQLGWTQIPKPCSSLMCNLKSGCSPSNRHWNCSCVSNAVAELPDFTFYWGSLSTTSFALCHAASMSSERPLLMNRIPWVTFISNKSQLATTCIGHKHINDDSICLQRHVPATFIIDRNTNRSTLPTLAHRLLAMHPVWIIKPHNYAKGEGIQIAFKEDGEEVLLRQLTSERWGSSKVIQCYMTDPMLLAKKKFDLRVFLLLVTTGAGLVAFYHQGYVRLALNDFLVFDKQHLDTHLTNQAVQAKQATYEANKEETTWTVQQMNAYLNKASGRFGDDWTLKQLHPTIKSLVAALVEALVQRVQREEANRRQRYPCRNNFNLLGLDVLIDSLGKPWLIEANADPALSRQTRTLEQLLPSVAAEAFGLAAEIITRSWAAEMNGSLDETVTSFEKLEFLQNFQPIGYYRVSHR